MTHFDITQIFEGENLGVCVDMFSVPVRPKEAEVCLQQVFIKALAVIGINSVALVEESIIVFN